MLSLSLKKIHQSWVPLFESVKEDLEDVAKILEEDTKKGHRVCPEIDAVFRAYELTSLNGVKVVIMGQDPYFNLDNNGQVQATGLSFSVNKGVKLPSSVYNIFKELKSEYPDTFNFPDHGSLEKWAEQGVLLLNSCLTCRLYQSGSHGDIWMFLIIETIKEIAKVNPNCIYVLWGAWARKLRKYIGSKSIVLESAHPSGLSAYARNGVGGFFGNNHFRKINDLLKDNIDWNL